MVTHTFNEKFYNESDAEFRAWGSRISAALDACNLPKTENTGQIDWATVTRSTATAGTISIGYEMRRFNDVLQADYPLFVRIYYGYKYNQNTWSSSYSRVGQPVIWIWVGHATDGGANITGNYMPQRMLSMGYQATYSSTAPTNPTQTFSTGFFSGDGSSIQFCIGVDTSAQPLYDSEAGGWQYSEFPWTVWIERTRNADGTPNGDGVMFGSSYWPSNRTAATSPTSQWQVLTYSPSPQVSALVTHLPITWPGGNAFSTATEGVDLFAFPPSVSTPKLSHALGFLGIYKSDVALGTVVSMPVLGQPRNYISLAGMAAFTNNDNMRSNPNTIATNGALLMRWE